MARTSLRRQILFLLLGALLALPWGAAAEPRRTARVSPPVHSPALVELASRAWSLLTNVWGKEGSMIDPNGYTATVDAGPSGQSETAASPGDSGSMIDPNGRN